MNIAAFVISVISVVVALVAILVTWRLSQEAKESLRKSTKVAVFSSAQILRNLAQTLIPDEVDIIWSSTRSANVIDPGRSIELSVEAVTSGRPLYYPEEEIPKLNCRVVAPSGRWFRGAADRVRRYSDSRYCWHLVYPADFDEAGSNEEGMYVVRWLIPDCPVLFDSFFVLA